MIEFVSDPPISVKLRKMKERVRWQDSLIVERGIDQTRLDFRDRIDDSPDFSFLVIGDSGAGPHPNHNPQRKIAELMLEHSHDSRFVLHTGDVVYQVGSSEYYERNFISPYREFLVGGESPEQIAYDRMVFNKPFLPVPGNHDYYDLPFFSAMLAQTTWPLRHLLRSKLDLGVGWHGSNQGDAYARAFLDYLKTFDNRELLRRHLDCHYTAQTSTGRCLRYEPGQFTRLPNHYYTFRTGGIDFFALDSNTFNAPAPLPKTKEGDAQRRQLKQRRQELEQEKQHIMEASTKLDPNQPDDADILDDYWAKLEQIEEVELDINKQLAANLTTVTDFEQLDWLKERLIESWHTQEVRGRVVYFHHPPYVTEATKWYQAQTLEVRHRLREVFDAVAQEIKGLTQGRPIVDLVLSGHAHCLEHLYTTDTGYADSHIHWIVCGGSGHSLRRQRREGSELIETFEKGEGDRTRSVAKSLLYIGRHGRATKKRRPYSFLRIDVQSGCPPKFIVQPFVTERRGREWKNSHLKPFEIQTLSKSSY
ncbi:MAG TPA: metallophosphoesterase [Coleofasciculaceae cyanobacterium]